MTPSIYTVGQLRAYLQGKRAVLNEPVPPQTTDPQVIEVRLAQTAVCDEVIALCTAIEAYQAATDAVTAGHAPEVTELERWAAMMRQRRTSMSSEVQAEVERYGSALQRDT